MFREITVKVHYTIDDGLLKNDIIEMTPPERVEKYLKPELEEIFDAEGYIGMEIEVKDYIAEKELCKGWTSDMIAKPDIHKWVIVRDSEGIEYPNHQWNGSYWYSYIRDDNGSCDGWRSYVNVTHWKYQ